MKNRECCKVVNVSVLTNREIKRIIRQKRTLYLSYLVADKYINRYNDKSVSLLCDYYKNQKSHWSQISNDSTHVFLVEYDFLMNVLSVHSKINTNIYFCHGVFDMSKAGDSSRTQFIAGLYICEYEQRLDEFVSKFRLSKPPQIEDYKFPS